MYDSLGSLVTRVYASLVTMCIIRKSDFQINGYFVLVARMMRFILLGYHS